MEKYFELKSVRLTVIATAMLLVSCNGLPGGESADLPASRPQGQINGFVVDEQVVDARFNVYAFDDGVKGELLATTVTNDDGSYGLNLTSRSRPVLIEVSGGFYVELASGVSVELVDDQVLRAVALYKSGEPLSVMVTPLTHLVAGLAAHKIAAGLNVQEAVAEAGDQISQLFGFDVIKTFPRSISDPGEGAGLTDEYLYGFSLAALSSWSRMASQANGLAVHDTYSTIAVTQILYNDIQSDGLLNGRGFNKSGDAMMDLAVGTVPLSPAVYRIELAQHMLAMAANNVNATTISVTDLLPEALALINSEAEMLADVDNASDKIELYSVLPNGLFRNNSFEFSVVISNVALAEKVRFFIDDVWLADAVDPTIPVISIDTTLLDDGEHTIKVVVENRLGGTVEREFSFIADNTSPFVNISSSPVTSSTRYTIAGGFGDNGAGVRSISVQGNIAVMGSGDSWSAIVDLLPGHNTIEIIMLDWAGNEIATSHIIDLDQTAPVLTPGVAHGPARFSDGSGHFTNGVLAKENSTPLFLETNRVDLRGVTVARTALESNVIPYFAFKARDPLAHDVATADDQLSVTMRYEKNGQAITDWRVLGLVGDEYLIPLATEMLDASWLASNPSDQHLLRVRFTDEAGNSGEAEFRFKTDFIVPGITVASVADVGGAIFTSTAFVNRGNLHDMDFVAMKYTFTNTTGKAFFIQLDDEGGHTAEREVEQLVREHKARLRTTTEWQAGFVNNVSNMCADTPEISETLVTKIENFTGGNWVTEYVPAPVLGDIENLNSDAPEPAANSGWQDIPDFDNEFATYDVALPGGSHFSYNFDYVASASSSLKPAYVKGWLLSIPGSPPTTCPDQRLFQQRFTYSYESEAGYPKNIASTFHDVQPFGATSFSVTDNTVSSEIDSFSGWYRIPAGHSVTVSKRVHTPAMTVDNNTDVASPGSFTSYTHHRYDKRIVWSVNSGLTITAVHDAGEANIFAMTPTNVESGEGVNQYQITR